MQAALTGYRLTAVNAAINQTRLGLLESSALAKNRKIACCLACHCWTVTSIIDTHPFVMQAALIEYILTAVDAAVDDARASLAAGLDWRDAWADD